MFSYRNSPNFMNDTLNSTTLESVSQIAKKRDRFQEEQDYFEELRKQGNKYKDLKDNSSPNDQLVTSESLNKQYDSMSMNPYTAMFRQLFATKKLFNSTNAGNLNPDSKEFFLVKCLFLISGDSYKAVEGDSEDIEADE